MPKLMQAWLWSFGLSKRFASRFCLCSALADGLGRVSRGVQHLGLLGIFSTNSVVRLEKSPNKLRYFPPVGNTRACASIKSVVHCSAVCIFRPADDVSCCSVGVDDA